jgi:hypothetical protein
LLYDKLTSPPTVDVPRGICANADMEMKSRQVMSVVFFMDKIVMAWY